MANRLLNPIKVGKPEPSIVTQTKKIENSSLIDTEESYVTNKYNQKTTPIITSSPPEPAPSPAPTPVSQTPIVTTPQTLDINFFLPQN